MPHALTPSSPDATAAAPLLQRLAERSARIAVCGLGYVGLPLAIRLAAAGFPVIGFDVDPAKPAALGEGRSYLSHIPDRAVATLAGADFRATGDVRELASADVFLMCVPTPLDAHREPDLGFVVATLETIAPLLRADTMVVLESTTWPGTTEEILRPRLEAAGFAIGRDLFLAYSPEREDPGNPIEGRHVPKICAGVTAACLAHAVTLYEAIVDEVVPMSSPRAAEMTKLLENIHRSVNIGLVNEMKLVTDRMGLDIHEIVDAAATKPFGFVPYRPGPGLGGHCIPIDPFYLTWKAREYGVHTRFIELAGEINSAMPEWVVRKVARALNDARKPVRGSRVLVLGVAYKKNVDDSRETPAAEILGLLQELGAETAYSDPFVPVFPKKRDYAFDLVSLELTADTLARQDCVVLVTDHDAFDYELILGHAPLIVDTRGRLRGRKAAGMLVAA